MQEIMRQKPLLIEYALFLKIQFKNISNHKKVVIHAKVSSENVINDFQTQQGFIV